jgi:hypothetical protein
MIAKCNFIYVISLYLFISSTWAMTLETSSSMRPTDIVYKKVESDAEPVIEYQDYQIKNTEMKKQATLPNEIYLNMPVMSSCMVPNPQNPKQIILVKHLNKKLGLPGGYLDYGEDPSVGAARKFSEKVNFKMENESIKKAGLIAGFFGRPTLEVMRMKSTPYGPFMGVFGIGNRATKRPNISFVYNFIIGNDYVTPVLGNKAALDVMYCDVVEMLARNLDQITDEVENHPLNDLREKVLEKDAQMLQEANQDEAEEKTLAQLDKCQQELQDDTLQVLNLYYLNLIKFWIIEDKGDLKEDAKSYLWNKSELAKYKNKL